ncbi:MAG: PA2778 family cysteine peptidase [Gallionellaceae bacterium]|jgi:tetratricopeptide (TPR) repeat protein
MRYSLYARFFAGIFTLLGLMGCATSPSPQVLKSFSGPQQVELLDVPFFPQEPHQCGPAALAMLLNASGAKVTPEALAPQVYLPGRQGSLQVEMQAATRRAGLFAYVLSNNLQALLTEVSAGSPVLVMQNLAFSWSPVWHYAVVVGYDLQRGEIILRSGLERRAVLPFVEFERTWQLAGSWAMLALPPGQMPVTAQASVYLAEAIKMEKFVASATAEKIYAAALQVWPQNHEALIGMGNAVYAQGETARAEAFFLQASHIYPDSLIAFNNLAQTLADQQRYTEALVAATRAVNIGGQELKSAQNTLAQIQRNMLNK